MKVGNYVRTKWGYICKIININEFREPSMKYGVEASYLKDIMFIGEEEIIKSSPNIIDILQVGDYVNGCPVLHKENNELVCGLLLRYKEENIQNVVTKEQFSSMKYKIGE